VFAEDHDDDSVLGVDALLRLARDRSAAARTRLVEIITDMFFDDTRVLNERERTTMNDILRQLIHDVEISVRKHLAIRLSDEPNAPGELVLALANNDAEIAHPILVRSEVLRDPELIEIIHNRTREYQLAIAMRTTVSTAVSDALVATDSEPVIRKLLENPGAEIAGETMAYLVEQSQRIDAFQNPLVRRTDLPARLAQQMYWWVSAALRTEILANHDMDPDELDDVIESAVAAAKRNDHVAEAADTPVMRLVDRLIDRHGMSGELLIELLRTGEIGLFEGLIERSASLRREREAGQSTPTALRSRSRTQAAIAASPKAFGLRTRRDAKIAYPASAATPGKVLPSSHSRNAPPAVET
jgi:uncharacterized protein (DUF2336 family)